MGDTFSNITGSTIVNRSLVNGALNQIERSAGESAAKALRQLADIVEKSGNAEAAEYLDSMNDELQKDTPRKSILRVMWDGIINALPTITQATSLVGEVQKLIA